MMSSQNDEDPFLQVQAYADHLLIQAAILTESQRRSLGTEHCTAAVQVVSSYQILSIFRE